MIPGRRYIPINKSIEVHKDPNSYFSKQSASRLMIARKSDQGSYSFVKPLSKIERSIDMRGNIDEQVSRRLHKASPLLDKPPTVEDFAQMSRMITQKYGPKVRVSSINMNQDNMDKFMGLKVKVPKRNRDGSVISDGHGGMVLVEKELSDMLNTDLSQFRLLNAMNNTNQNLGAITMPLVKELFRRNFEKLSPIERDETFKTLKMLDKNGSYLDATNLPVLIDMFYIVAGRFQHEYKSKLYYILRNKGLSDAQAVAIFASTRYVLHGPTLERFDPTRTFRRNISDILIAHYGGGLVSQMSGVFIKNLLSNVQNGNILWARVNADKREPQNELSMSLVYLVAEAILNGLAAAQGNAYGALYGVIADWALNRYTNYGVASRRTIINASMDLSGANNLDFTQIVQRNPLVAPVNMPIVPANRGFPPPIAPGAPVPIMAHILGAVGGV